MKAAGIHLSEQERSLVEGRLARRPRQLGMRDYKPYVDLLQCGDAGGTELFELINAITTNKTSFFEDRIGDLQPGVLKRHFLHGARGKDDLYKVRHEVQGMVNFERVTLVDGADSRIPIPGP